MAAVLHAKKTANLTRVAAARLLAVKSTSVVSRNNERLVHLGEHFTEGSLNEIALKVPVPLAGRKYLPGSQVHGFPKHLSGPRENYPLFIKVVNVGNTSLEHWAKRCREIVDQAYERYLRDRTAVAILFRGLPIKNERDLSAWTNGLGFEPFRYVGGTAPRHEIEQNVAEGALDDKEFTIEPHNEMAYSARYPKIFVVGNFITAPWGGETAVCDNREVLAKLDPSFVETCERKGLRYWHYLPDKNAEGKLFQSWQLQFLTDDRQNVEEYLKKRGSSYAWDSDGSLSYWEDKSPFIKHARSGEKLWFNQITANHCSYHASSPLFEGIKLPNKKYPFHTTFSDGEEIDQSLIDEHRRVTWESAVGFQWHDGDALLIDQLILQHSRLGFEGDRKVGISLLDY